MKKFDRTLWLKKIDL